MMRRRLRAALAALLSVFAVAAAFPPSAHADKPPYTDFQARGYITLYDRSNAVVTSGDINAHPFVWRAVGSEPAPAPYNSPGGKATLLAYIPREGANVGDWSGDQLTLATAYEDPAHPKAQASDADFSLTDLFSNLPPRWNGFVQIRMIYTMPDAPPVTQGYAATDIQISGDTWTVVRGGVPVEEANPPAPVTGAPPASTDPAGAGSDGSTPGQTTGGPTPGGTTSDGASPAPSVPGSAGTNDPPGADPTAAESSQGSGHLVRNVTAIVLLVLVAGIGAVVLIARRRPRGPDPL